MRQLKGLEIQMIVSWLTEDGFTSWSDLLKNPKEDTVLLSRVVLEFAGSVWDRTTEGVVVSLDLWGDVSSSRTTYVLISSDAVYPHVALTPFPAQCRSHKTSFHNESLQVLRVVWGAIMWSRGASQTQGVSLSSCWRSTDPGASGWLISTV